MIYLCNNSSGSSLKVGVHGTQYKFTSEPQSNVIVGKDFVEYDDGDRRMQVGYEVFDRKYGVIAYYTPRYADEFIYNVTEGSTVTHIDDSSMIGKVLYIEKIKPHIAKCYVMWAGQIEYDIVMAVELEKLNEDKWNGLNN